MPSWTESRVVHGWNNYLYYAKFVAQTTPKPESATVLNRIYKLVRLVSYILKNFAQKVEEDLLLAHRDNELLTAGRGISICRFMHVNTSQNAPVKRNRVLVGFHFNLLA